MHLSLSSQWLFALASSQPGVLMLWSLCGQHLETQKLCLPWLLLWQLFSPSRPPFTTLLYISSSSPTFASHCAGIWPSAKPCSADAFVILTQRTREHAGMLTLKMTATPHDFLMGCQKTTAHVGTVPVLHPPQDTGDTVKDTVHSRQPGFCKDLSTAKWQSVSCPTNSKVTSSELESTLRYKERC